MTTFDESISKDYSRRSALAAFGIGGLAAAVAVVGHDVSWGKFTQGYPVKPYTLTQGALERFNITERIHLQIDGLGEEVVGLVGSAVFRRYSPNIAPEAQMISAPLNWATAEVKVDFLSLDTKGTSPSFGDVSVRLAPDGAHGAIVRPHPTDIAQMKQAAGASADFTGFKSWSASKECSALIKPIIKLGKLAEELHLGTDYIRLGSEVSVVPPVGDVARTTGSVPLFDARGKQVGQLMGADIEIGTIVSRSPFEAAQV